MAKPRKSDSIGAAECARRTGLTVRALRVYERHGLIEPARSAKGWRRYGPKEIARLNVIVTLKALGLTLMQIRSVVATSPPPLARVLHLQLEAWRTRKAAAETALGLVQAALARVESKHPLSLEELCNLARSMDMSNHQAVTRELINKAVTPEEERSYVTWWAARPPEEAVAMRDYSVAMRGLFGSLHGLMEKEAAPEAPEVQTLVDHWNELALRFGLRKTMLDLLEWDASIARKWMDVGERALSRTPSTVQNPRDQGLWGYFMDAVRASGWHRALMTIVDEAVLLAEGKAAPASAPATALADRLAQICIDHSLGDPVVYARWSCAIQRSQSADIDARRGTGWKLLANALYNSRSTTGPAK